jgi:hypothetical protein
MGSMAKTKQSRYVIFAGPQQRLESGSCYIALDGYSTILKSKAARFQSCADAQAFAEVSRVALNDTYIHQEDFTEVELMGQAGESVAHEHLVA